MVRTTVGGCLVAVLLVLGCDAGRDNSRPTAPAPDWPGDAQGTLVLSVSFAPWRADAAKITAIQAIDAVRAHVYTAAAEPLLDQALTLAGGRAQGTLTVPAADGLRVVLVFLEGDIVRYLGAAPAVDVAAGDRVEVDIEAHSMGSTVTAPARVPAGQDYVVRWQARPRVTGYQLEEATTGDFADAVVRYEGMETAFPLTGPAPGTYFYRVRVATPYGWGPWPRTTGGAVTQAETLAPGDDAFVERVYVEGGRLPDIGNDVLEVESFSIGQYAVSWGQWQAVRDGAEAHGYDLAGVGEGCADDHPVRTVSWYDAVKWSNALSELQGRTPVYTVGGSVYRTGAHDEVEVDARADGYRLPTAAEWEYAARGGQQSQGYTYSGSDDLDAVGWYTDNSGGAACALSQGRGTWPVGQKAPNELGLYDMSGNVWEWCFDRNPEAGYDRIIRGGSWSNSAAGCRVVSRVPFAPGVRSYILGFRLVVAAE